MVPQQMALRYEHATRERDRFIAHALQTLAQSVGQAPNPPAVTADDRGDRARSRTQRARRSTDEEGGRTDTNSEQAVSPDRVRPLGFEPETCGLRVKSMGFHGYLGLPVNALWPARTTSPLITLRIHSSRLVVTE